MNLIIEVVRARPVAVPVTVLLIVVAVVVGVWVGPDVAAWLWDHPRTTAWLTVVGVVLTAVAGTPDR